MRFQFENYVLDSDARELTRAGTPILLQPQVFDVLLCLIEQRGRVVGKDDLISQVWGDRAVSDSALNSRINAARSAIGDDGQAQRLIRTVPRKGFRFVGEVTEQVQSANPSMGLAAEPLSAPDRRLPCLPSRT